MVKKGESTPQTPEVIFFLLLLKVIFHNSLQNHLPSGHVYNFHVTIFRKKYQMIIIFLKISIKRPVQPLFNDGNKRWKTRMIKNWVCLISMQCLINSKYMLITWKKYKSYSGKSGFLFPAIDLLLAYLQRYVVAANFHFYMVASEKRNFNPLLFLIYFIFFLFVQMNPKIMLKANYF